MHFQVLCFSMRVSLPPSSASEVSSFFPLFFLSIFCGLYLSCCGFDCVASARFRFNWKPLFSPVTENVILFQGSSLASCPGCPHLKHRPVLGNGDLDCTRELSGFLDESTDCGWPWLESGFLGFFRLLSCLPSFFFSVPRGLIGNLSQLSVAVQPPSSALNAAFSEILQLYPVSFLKKILIYFSSVLFVELSGCKALCLPWTLEIFEGSESSESSTTSILWAFFPLPKRSTLSFHLKLNSLDSRVQPFVFQVQGKQSSFSLLNSPSNTCLWFPFRKFEWKIWVSLCCYRPDPISADCQRFFRKICKTGPLCVWGLWLVKPLL